MITEDQRLTIMYGDVLSVFGVPQNFDLLAKHGMKIFDKRTRLHKKAMEIRRQQLKQEYGIEG